MKKTTRFLSWMLSAAMAATLLAGCGGGGGETGDAGTGASESFLAEQEGVIEGEAMTGMADKVVVQSGSSSEDPSPFAPSVGGIIKNFLYGKLIDRNYYGALLEDCSMWLAKSVTKVDDYTYDIELYDYITDSQGNNINADDVIFSYKMSYEEGNFLRIGSSMKSLDKTGEYSLRMTLNTNAPGVAEDLMSNVQLDIVDQQWYENATEEERRKNPATTGPYRIVSEVAGSSTVIEAVENYWQTDKSLNPPAASQNVKTIEFKVITEPAMSAIALENHEVDSIFFNDATTLSYFFENGAPKEGYNVNLGNGTFTMDVFLNMSEGSVFADNLALRQAVLYALSAEDVLFATGNNEYTSFVPLTLGTDAMNGYQEQWDQEDYYGYDPDKATQLLEEAGYAPGELTLTFMSSAGQLNDSGRSVIVSNLEEIGINVELLTVDTALFNTYKYDATQWDFMIDFKGAGTGHITGIWDSCFNPSGFTDGTSVCLNRDDELVNLLNAVNNDPSDENINAFHYYLKDQAYCKGMYANRSIIASTDGILEIATDALGNPRPNAYVFAADYQSGQ